MLQKRETDQAAKDQEQEDLRLRNIRRRIQAKRIAFRMQKIQMAQALKQVIDL